MEKKFNEQGIINPDYANQIKQACRDFTESDLDNKLIEVEEYFKQRKKNGWPFIKTGQDLDIECQLVPLIHDCLKYLKGELIIDSN